MFDFAWSEIGLIAVVALVFIGPKDMPVAIKTVSGMVKKARKMAAEFQTHVDEMVREADLGEVRDQITKIRNFDLRGEIEKAVDSDGTITKTFNENPVASGWNSATASATSSVGEHAVAEIDRPDGVDAAFPAEPEAPHVPPTLAPAFLPPGLRTPTSLQGSASRRPPAFIPPQVARSSGSYL